MKHAKSAARRPSLSVLPIVSILLLCAASMVHAAMEASGDRQLPTGSVGRVVAGIETTDELMGARQRKFWARLRSVLDHPEWLVDYSKVESALGLMARYPSDPIDPNLRRVQISRGLHNLSEGMQFIDDGRYGVLQAVPAQEFYRVLEVHLTTLSICLTASHVEQAYGPGQRMPVMVSHGAPIEVVIGNPYALVYKNVKGENNSMVFGVMPSGCIRAVTLRQNF